ncbi:substrate-binding domain-containing protein [Phytohabitans sp. ZYX-F-186]|uniref:Substrate-binding domain-containing protein n=1 Tax=Phytohabitans maris TaxID=3071409 RepID=A0ABU0ZL83_9ACTN|nr:substrate-binding domain-containing protein [Phytohabitans sp. ZYX-F-186]MDQ7907341.1 substrate-binding domain-containing protein [Phytohabitans sp. ZYX-F-186]
MADKVTIATVAAHANVSRQTVSNVLNTPHLVREETRERVREAIAVLGYRANQAARLMRTGRSHLLAVRIEPTRDGINGSVLDRFLHGLTEAAAPAGYRILLYAAADDQAEIATYDDLLATYELDGFVLTSTHHGDVRTSWLAERGVPFVTFGRPWGRLGADARTEPAALSGAAGSHPWVDVDNAAGTAAATRHLLDAGHRRIGFIGWPEGSGVGDERRAGWAATAGADLPELARATVDGVAEGEAAAHDLLSISDPPTALVCASDSLAAGAYGVAPPGVAVTGFDDTAVARVLGLTSVAQPLAEAAARCVDLLAGVLDGGAAPHPVLLPPSLVIRQSA